MLAGITYTEISDQDESEPGCPRLKSTYEITAHFPFVKYAALGRLRLPAWFGAGVWSEFITPLQWKAFQESQDDRIGRDATTHRCKQSIRCDLDKRDR
jgi:hypothetical protein